MRSWMMTILTKSALVAVLALAAMPVRAETMIKADILNFSEMVRWVQVTDLVCDKELYKDRLGAQEKLPVELCAGEDGKAKVKLYVRIGCTKNQTFIKDEIEDGATVNF